MKSVSRMIPVKEGRDWDVTQGHVIVKQMAQSLQIISEGI